MPDILDYRTGSPILDHICAGRFLTGKFRRTFMIDSRHMATTVISDHDMVCGELTWLRKPAKRVARRHLYHWCSVLRLRHRCARTSTRRACRQDKKTWLAGKCEQLRDCFQDQRNQYHALLKGLKISRWQPTPRANYSLTKGRLAVSVEELSTAWAEHWMSKLGGTTPHLDSDWLRFDKYEPVGLTMVSSSQSVRCDEDDVLASLLYHLSSLAKRRPMLCTPVFNCVFDTGQIPACWRGASVCAVPKPKEPSACRPI
eukprot:5457238-Amphidinium_carterae.5